MIYPRRVHTIFYSVIQSAILQTAVLLDDAAFMGMPRYVMDADRLVTVNGLNKLTINKCTSRPVDHKELTVT